MRSRPRQPAFLAGPIRRRFSGTVLAVCLLVAVVSLGCSLPGAAPAKLEPITIAQGSQGLSYAPVYVAVAMGFFEKEGIKADLQHVQGGAAALAAVTGGSAQFGGAAISSPVASIAKGAPIVVVQGVANKMTMDLVLNKRFAEQKGLTAASTPEAVVKALKGGTLGTASLGGAPDRYSRWLMQKYGFNSETDINVVRIGGLGEILAAIKQGTINGAMWSPPAGVQATAEGYGVVAVAGGSVPEFRVHTFETLFARTDYLEKNPDTARKVLRAVAKASDLVAAKPKDTIPALKQYFDMSPEVVEKSLNGLAGAFGNRGLMSEQTWANSAKVMYESKAIDVLAEAKEGKYWTNKYNP